MQQRFLLQILLLAQHVSGTTVPIIRSSRVSYSGCCLWYFVLWFSSCWSGVELRVTQPSAPHQTSNLKTTAWNTTGSNHCLILSSSWWWTQWCPKHVEQGIRSAIKTSVVHILTTMHGQNHIKFKWGSFSLSTIMSATVGESVYLKIIHLNC